MTQKTKQTSNNKVTKLTRKVDKLEHLLSGYKHIKAVQYAILQLSELSSSVTDIPVFYAAMHKVIGRLLKAENFYVVLVDSQTNHFNPVYFSDITDTTEVQQLNSKEFETGLTGYVYRTAQSLMADQTKLEQLMTNGDVVAHGQLPSHWMGVPLTRGHKAIGVIAIQSYDNTYYSDDDRTLLEFISRHLVTAIDRLKQRELLEQSVRDRTKELSCLNQNLQIQIKERQRGEELQSALFKISQITATSVLMDDFYQSIHEVLKNLMYADNCYIALISPDGEHLSFVFYVDAKKSQAEPRKMGLGLTEYVITKGEACLIDRTEMAQLVEQKVIFRRQKDQAGYVDAPSCWLGAPLIINDEVIGVISTQAYDDEHQYCNKDLNVLCFVSHHLAVAIQRKLANDKLRNSHDELESKVLTRTQELRQSNLFLKLQVEERKKVEERLSHEANHDALTGLPNRKMLLARLEETLVKKLQNEEHNFAVLFIDLDRFKIINDTMGHHVGDQFLIEVSSRITSCIRENDILARLGGDEFVILLDLIQDMDDAEEIAQRIIMSVGAAFCINNQEIYSGASVGIAECSPEYETADELLRDADAAMYQAKNMGRGRFIVFDETMHQRLMDDLNIEQALHHAVKDQSLFPRYLSMHNVKTGDCLGYKTKTYWHHPELGEVEQSYFIELAESNGLITTIDQQILTEVCWQMRKGGQLEDVGIISVNLSATHLTQRSSLQLLLDIVKASGIDRHKLCFEFTESSLLKLADVSLNAFKRIKQTGVSIAIQGFGAGVSSLGLLTQNSIDYVKTDRNFTRSLLKNTKNKALLETLIKLSFSFDFKVILEGIDNKALQELALDYQVFIGLGDHFDSQEVVKAAQKPVLRLHKFA